MAEPVSTGVACACAPTVAASAASAAGSVVTAAATTTAAVVSSPVVLTIGAGVAAAYIYDEYFKDSKA